ncbi:MAG: HAD family hydrolase [Raoultibacter sp.]|jgi:phosphoglycolate phosphatase
MTPRFDTFIFDLDGTLLDTLPDLVINTNMALEQMGYPIRDEQEVLASVGEGLPVLIRRLLPEGSTEAEAEATMDCWKRIYPEYGRKTTQEYPGTTDMLKTLQSRGIKTAVLSNKFNKGTQELISDFFPGLFQIVHGEGASIPRKPNPTGLLLTMEELGAKPETTVYVGDSVGDIEVARKAHVASIGAAWGCYGAEILEAANADIIAYSPSELLTYTFE